MSDQPDQNTNGGRPDTRNRFQVAWEPYARFFRSFGDSLAQYGRQQVANQKAVTDVTLGAVEQGAQWMAENPDTVQSWLGPLEGPSKVVGSLVAGQSPFRWGEGGIRPDAPTFAQSLEARGVPPGVAMALDLALVPDPTGASRAVDLIPIMGMIFGFRGLTHLVPGAADDLTAARTLLQDVPSIVGAAPEAGPDELRLMAQQLWAVSKAPDAGEYGERAAAAATRLEWDAMGIEHVQARTPVAVDPPKAPSTSTSPVMKYLQRVTGTDLESLHQKFVDELASIGASGSILSTETMDQRLLLASNLRYMLDKAVAADPGGPEVIRYLEALSALPDAKGAYADDLLRGVMSGELAPEQVRDQLDALRYVIVKEQSALRSLNEVRSAGSMVRDLMSQGRDSDWIDASVLRRDIEAELGNAMEALQAMADGRLWLGYELQGDALRIYEDVMREGEEYLSALDSYLMMDTAVQATRTLEDSLEYATKELNQGTVENLLSLIQMARTRDEAVTILGAVFPDEEEAARVADYVWSTMRTDPITGSELPMVEPRVTTPEVRTPQELLSVFSKGLGGTVKPHQAADYIRSMFTTPEEAAKTMMRLGMNEQEARLLADYAWSTGTAPTYLPVHPPDSLVADAAAATGQSEDHILSLLERGTVDRDELVRLIRNTTGDEAYGSTIPTDVDIERALDEAPLPEPGQTTGLDDAPNAWPGLSPNMEPPTGLAGTVLTPSHAWRLAEDLEMEYLPYQDRFSDEANRQMTMLLNTLRDSADRGVSMTAGEFYRMLNDVDGAAFAAATSRLDLEGYFGLPRSVPGYLPEELDVITDDVVALSPRFDEGGDLSGVGDVNEAARGLEPFRAAAMERVGTPVPDEALSAYEKIAQASSEGSTPQSTRDRLLRSVDSGFTARHDLVMIYQDQYGLTDDEVQQLAIDLFGSEISPEDVQRLRDIASTPRDPNQPPPVDISWYQDNPAAREPGNADAQDWLRRSKNVPTANYEGPATVEEVLALPGVRDEHLNIKADDERVAQLVESMRQEGFHSYEPIFINVEADGRARINEGNHRIRAAAALGMTEVPVIVRYFGGGEMHSWSWMPTALRRYLGR